MHKMDKQLYLNRTIEEVIELLPMTYTETVSTMSQAPFVMSGTIFHCGEKAKALRLRLPTIILFSVWQVFIWLFGKFLFGCLVSFYLVIW